LSRLLVLVDRSSSMNRALGVEDDRRRRIDVAFDAAWEALRSVQESPFDDLLGRPHEVGLVAFDDVPFDVLGGFVPAADLIRNEPADILPRGKADLAAAIEYGNGLLESGDRSVQERERDVVILISDGSGQHWEPGLQDGLGVRRQPTRASLIVGGGASIDETGWAVVASMASPSPIGRWMADGRPERGSYAWNRLAVFAMGVDEAVGAARYLARLLVLNSVDLGTTQAAESFDPRTERTLLLAAPLSRDDLAERTALYFYSAAEVFGFEQADRARRLYLDEETLEDPFVLMGLHINLAPIGEPRPR
jgi:hypothetical protein